MQGACLFLPVEQQEACDCQIKTDQLEECDSKHRSEGGEEGKQRYVAGTEANRRRRRRWGRGEKSGREGGKTRKG